MVGVGYEVYMLMICFYELLEVGQEVIVFIYFVVCEDVQLLYGFNNKQECILFKELIKINGVGFKLVLVIFFGMLVQQFVNVVEWEEVVLLVKLLGIGKKIVECLIVEMKDCFKGLYGDLFILVVDLVLILLVGLMVDDVEQEVVVVLVVLGYKLQEVSWMVSKIVCLDVNSEMLICEVLCVVL